MKATELIELLKRKIEDYGDWEVAVFNDKVRHYDEELEEWFEDETQKSIDDIETITADGGNGRLFLLK